MTLAESLRQAIVLSEEQMNQRSCRPVVSSGVKAIEGLGEQWSQLGDTLLEAGEQSAALAWSTREEALQQLLGTDRGGNWGSGEHGGVLT
jgi:hypothetical protein